MRKSSVGGQASKPYFSEMWANNCPAGLLKNKKLDIFVPGFARHFLFRAGKQCELTINFDGEGYRAYADRTDPKQQPRHCLILKGKSHRIRAGVTTISI